MRFASARSYVATRIPQFPLANDNAGETYVYPASLFRRGSVPPPTGRIPREIVEFFNSPGGHSLIVKGPAGTGKTTFALQLTEALGEVTASHYLSSRVLVEYIYLQFTLLREQVNPKVLESSGEPRLDYLGDGVISLASTDHQGRRLRVLTIEKLRGQQIQQHRYLYTLDGGRLTAFDIRDEVRPVKPQLWRPVKDLSKDAVSFGLEPLDRLTGGLYRGRVVAFEISNAVPSDYVDWLRTAIICNFVVQGRGVAHVPPRKGSAEFLRELVSPHLTPGAFDSQVRVFESATLGSADVSRTVLHMEGTNVDSDLKWSNVEFQLPKSERPFLAFMAFDTLESVYGEKVLEQMSGVFAAVRRVTAVFIGFVTPQSASAAKLENLARVVLHLDSINGSVVLYGQKPYTELFGLAWDWSGGVPKADLRPIV